jgi:hypothetical protein
MQLKYHEQALQNNIHVIGTCGFDSIPADMGVVFASEQFPGEYFIALYSLINPSRNAILCLVCFSCYSFFISLYRASDITRWCDFAHLVSNRIRLRNLLITT